MIHMGYSTDENQNIFSFNVSGIQHYWMNWILMRKPNLLCFQTS